MQPLEAASVSCSLARPGVHTIGTSSYRQKSTTARIPSGTPSRTSGVPTSPGSFKWTAPTRSRISLSRKSLPTVVVYVDVNGAALALQQSPTGTPLSLDDLIVLVILPFLAGGLVLYVIEDLFGCSEALSFGVAGSILLVLSLFVARHSTSLLHTLLTGRLVGRSGSRSVLLSAYDEWNENGKKREDGPLNDRGCLAVATPDISASLRLISVKLTAIWTLSGDTRAPRPEARQTCRGEPIVSTTGNRCSRQ